MNLNVLRRKIKSQVEGASDKASRKIPVLFLSLSGLVIVLLLFCIVQLAIVSVLSPRGKVLMEYNVEKELLVEENRILEQKIAERAALNVVSNRAEKDLKMKRANSVTYLQPSSVSAEAIPSE